MRIMEGYHSSVFLHEVIEALQVRTDKWYLDCTLGDGGHTKQIIARGGKVAGIDVDPQALKRAQERFEKEGINPSRFRLIQGNFRDIKNLIQSHFVLQSRTSRDKQTETEHQKFAGVIFDLGVSSLQLESPERGFSFAKTGPLDMRMDPDLAVRALDLLNVLSRKELYELFQTLGEEKYSWRLADAVVRAREIGKVTGDRVQATGISTTKDLADLAARVVGRSKDKIHPATKVFQALRIAVNDELGAIKEGLEQVKELLEKNGRIVVISFHSLEDRIVKNTFREWQLEGIGEVLTKKPIKPSEEEVRDNPRSRSAKMRIFEKRGNYISRSP